MSSLVDTRGQSTAQRGANGSTFKEEELLEDNKTSLAALRVQAMEGP